MKPQGQDERNAMKLPAKIFVKWENNGDEPYLEAKRTPRNRSSPKKTNLSE